MNRPPGRLLVCFAGGLGDLVMTLPLLAQAVRQCETWLYAFNGYGKWLDLIDLPDLRICKTDADLSLPYDAAIMTHSTPGIPPLDEMPPAIGWAGRNWPFPCHATEANLAAGQFVGLRGEPRFEFPIRTNPSSKLDGIKGEFVVVCPDAPALSRGVWTKKLLPFATWRKVTAALKGDCVVLCVDGAFPIDIGADICVAATSGADLAAILRAASAVFTVDCGVAHLASVLGAPTVVAWGPTSRQWSRPLGPKVAVVSKGLCGECLGMDKWQSCKTPICMTHTPRFLLSALKRLEAVEHARA